MAEELSIKARRKALELEKDEAELAEARAKAEMAQLDLFREKRLHRSAFEYSPHDRGKFTFSGAVNEGNCERLLQNVDQYAFLNPEGAVEITFDTPGGSVLTGLSLYDSLRAIAGRGHHFTTIARGMAGSMGAILLQAGDTRLVGPEAMFMLHEISSVTMGKLFEMEEDLKLTRTLNTKVFDIVARRTGGKYTGKSLYAKIKTHDWWLTAEETVANGFADSIG